jgi:mRNA interferase RelE/StbE
VAKYRILIKPSAVKEIEAISPKKDRQRLVDRISKLADNPRPPRCEKLSGQDKYRIRQGRYRIVYSIEDQDLIIYVVKVGHRKDVSR